ncbi:PrsW family intramembrane metalloprotease [Candidatus Wolfebacteria bacterium]|nr:PrsW family intramembrane metalloprotease [Candidatus Wolfebacteria bacterium]
MVFSFIILGLLPSFAWLLFFLKEDLHPEPKKMLAKVFFGGAFITILALTAQNLLRIFFNRAGIAPYDFLSFLTFGAIEEAMKFGVAYFIVRKSPFFDEPVDAMIYLITTALGFAMVENIAVLINASALKEALGVVTLRFVGATLLHALSSAIVGYFWAKSLIKSSESPLKVIGHWSLVIGLITASLLHGLFNYLIISLEDVVIYPTIFLILIALFVFWDFERLKSN